jgi:hypothetical protein
MPDIALLAGKGPCGRASRLRSGQGGSRRTVTLYGPSSPMRICSLLMPTIRSTAAILAAGLLIAPTTAHADWWTWLFGVKDYEECAENAAREAKSKDALAILLSSCESKFKGRRKPTSGYMLYDGRQNRYFDIAGPNPTPGEIKYIDGQYATYVAAQAERERKLQEELQSESVEAERQAAIAQAARAESEKRQQIARAESLRRQETALRKIELMSRSIECTLSTTCALYRFTIGVRNQSGETISALSFGWVFMPSETSDCPTSLPTKRRVEVQLAPRDTTALNIDGTDGPDGPSAVKFRYCVKVTGVEIIY